ncbi:hypothetical protein ACIBM3_27955 [Rhodococcus erythropolis]|uniref:hypothetical protein n=1 Tax=Rhodococcus erythropolis TaxID=1833 RepID=UPI00379DA866
MIPGPNVGGSRQDGTTAHVYQDAPVYGNYFGQSSFGTYALAYGHNTVKTPRDLPAVIAAPLGCGVQTGAGTVLNALKPEPGSSLVVYGAGGVGLSAVMAAVAAGCRVSQSILSALGAPSLKNSAPRQHLIHGKAISSPK